MRAFAAIISLFLALGPGVGVVSAQNFGSAAPERFFRVDAEGAQGRGAQPLVRGYVYNNSSASAERLQLLVESLDGSGQVIGKSLVRVDNIVPALGRTYFDAPVGVTGASYRVAVYYYDWIKCRG